MIKTIITILTASVLVTEVFTFPNKQSGTASWYGSKFHGRTTRYGEKYDMNKLTCASNTYPYNTILKVTNTRNGKSVLVRVTDTGGFDKYNRIIDLSRAAFARIESLDKGLARVVIEKVETENLK
jgi:rare lipoprotein A